MLILIDGEKQAGTDLVAFSTQQLIQFETVQRDRAMLITNASSDLPLPARGNVIVQGQQLVARQSIRHQRLRLCYTRTMNELRQIQAPLFRNAEYPCEMLARSRKCLSILTGLIVLFSFAASSVAQTFPERPIKVIVPFGAGGGSDTFARIIQKAIDDEDLLPHPLVIINVPGAGGTIGSRQARDAEPDGYTILCLHEAILTARKTGKVDYGPEAFEMIAGTGRSGLIYAVHDSSPYKSLGELMSAAHDHPGRITVGVNVGAPSHFVALRLEQSVPDIQFRFVNQGGGAERFGNLRGGHITMSVFSMAEFEQFKEAGMRALAYCGRERHPASPNLPTAMEQGYPVDSSNIQFWWAPKGTPPERIAVIANALTAAMNSSAVKARLTELRTEPIVLRGEQLVAEIKAHQDSLANIEVHLPAELPNLPLGVAIVTGLLAILAVGQPIIRRLRGQPKITAEQDDESIDASANQPIAWIPSVLIPILTIGYAALLTFRLMDFRIATAIFIVLSGLAFAERRVKSLPWLVPTAILFSIGVYHVFTTLLVIDLP